MCCRPAALLCLTTSSLPVPLPPPPPCRLSATDLVRREAERERDSLELQVQRLRAALAEERAQASTAAEEAAGQVATAREQAAVERQRAEMLQVGGGGQLRQRLGDAHRRRRMHALLHLPRHGHAFALLATCKPSPASLP